MIRLGKGPFYMLVSMDVEPSYTERFHEVYNTEHIPNISKVPGVLDIARVRPINFTMAIGGEMTVIPVPESEPSYTAVYTIEGPEVLTGPEFADAVEAGRWPTEIRPHTSNRRHILFEPYNGL